MAFWLALLSVLAVTALLLIILAAAFLTLRHLRRKTDDPAWAPDGAPAHAEDLPPRGSR